MQLALRRYATASVAVLGASLICVTPVTAPHIEQRAVDLATSETLSDLVGPTDAVVSSLGGLSGELSGVLPSLGDLSGTFADGASSATDLELLDPAFWELFWNALIDPSGESPELLLVGAIEQLPVIGPTLECFGLFALFPVILLLADAWSEISQAIGFDPSAAAAEGLGNGLQGVYDAALAGGNRSCRACRSQHSPGGPSPAVQRRGRGLDPSGLADIGTVLSTSTIPDLGEILTSLIP